MATERDGGWLDLEWYHVGFAAAYGLGAGAFAPPGTPPPVRLLELGLELSLAFVAVIVAVRAVRRLDAWRPPDVAGPEVAQSKYRFAVFAFLVAGMFLAGFASKPRAMPPQLLGVGIVPVNGFLAVSIAVDLRSLRSRGVEWGRSGYLYAFGAIILGPVAGLAYWWRRGRRRATSRGTASTP